LGAPEPKWQKQEETARFRERTMLFFSGATLIAAAATLFRRAATLILTESNTVAERGNIDPDPQQHCSGSQLH
jgi:hypothetical protein